MRSAINFFSLSLFDLENDLIMKKLFKFFYKERPLRPRYSSFWPVDKVLNYLKSWHPPSNLDMKKLTLKTISLMALSCSDRGQTIHMASIDSMTIYDSKIEFIINQRRKNTRRVLKPTKIVCVSTEIEELNVLSYISNYLERSKEFRNDQKQLFLSWKTKKPVTRPTIARWLKHVLYLSGIDTSIFKAHSYRGAGLSKAFQRGVPIHQIIAAGDWTNASTFHRYYNAPIEENIENVILEN